MKRDDGGHLLPPALAQGPGTFLPVGAMSVLGICGVLIVGQLLLHWDTLHSMLTIWNRSQTYTHGWIIAPISAYLIWLKRAELRLLPLHPSLMGVLFWMGLNVVWLLGHVAGALVVKQYALVAMIPAIAWAVLGTAAVWTIAFPLLFLLLAVPSGEVLVPAMIDFTADFTVKALQLSGIPVFREGTYFSVPSGDWSVVEACSGIRYLIASFTGGCLFAYLYYRGPWKRVAVILASLLIPIIANGMRAYMIVMIGHLSDMRLAVGVDHFIYGWVFFGVVMFALFWVASLWRDDDVQTAPPATGSAVMPSPPNVMKTTMVALILVVLSGSWWAYARTLDQRARDVLAVTLPEVTAAGEWKASAALITRWKPHYLGHDRTLNQTFVSQGREVMLYIAYYRGQQEGRELISSTNLLVPSGDHAVRIVGQRYSRISGIDLPVQETQTRSDTQKLLIWSWYAVDDQWFTNPFRGKWLLAKDRLLGRTGEGAAVFIATPYDTVADSSREVLTGFVHQMRAPISDSLKQARTR